MELKILLVKLSPIHKKYYIKMMSKSEPIQPIWIEMYRNMITHDAYVTDCLDDEPRGRILYP